MLFLHTPNYSLSLWHSFQWHANKPLDTSDAFVVVSDKIAAPFKSFVNRVTDTIQRNFRLEGPSVGRFCCILLSGNCFWRCIMFDNNVCNKYSRVRYEATQCNMIMDTAIQLLTRNIDKTLNPVLNPVVTPNVFHGAEI